ncbi:hypothetical protein PV433_10855 [Paenibacillus sp. GYB004]|uniref:Qat anti-phage system QueC-like protein QatC n=1 Tax=Paenibacillus sp. GYB004 TaxID=2994393 RepID=UPI002F96610B
MSWNIVCLEGETDTYTIEASDNQYVLPVPLYHSTHPNAIGNNISNTLSQYHLFPTEEAMDLLNAAIGIYTADVRVLRSDAHDNWTRDFILHLPVSHQEVWEGAVPIFERMLSFLTGDHWELRVRKSQRQVQKPLFKMPPFSKKVCLFSGGLDSFVGAIDLMAEKEPVFLVSHYTVGPLSEVQKQVYTLLDKQFPNSSRHLRFFVQPPKNSTKHTELTTRSRSILFMSLAIAAASSLGDDTTFYVPENGLISLNVPLTHTRTSSLSTRTTQPHFMSTLQSFIDMLGLSVKIETPYQFSTKGEMLLHAKHQSILKAGADYTMSCSHPGVGRHIKGGNPYQHCGYCVPCIIRRASMAAAGLDDAKPYAVDVLTNPPRSENGTGRDFRAFEMALHRAALPDFRPFLEVLNAGPLPGGAEQIQAYVDVYTRGMEEVRQFLYQVGE